MINERRTNHSGLGDIQDGSTLSMTVTMSKLVKYLEARSKPSYSRRWLFFRKRKPAAYPFEIRAGASAESIEDACTRLDVKFPDDLRSSYSTMDGMEDYTGTDAGFVRLLPLSEWKPLSEELESGYDPRYRSNVIFADYSIWAWWYAIELRNLDEFGFVRCFGGDDSWLVARSFDEYLDLTLKDDPAIYGPSNDGAAA